MNRRRFFQMAAGLLGALAVPVPKILEPVIPWRRESGICWKATWGKSVMHVFQARERDDVGPWVPPEDFDSIPDDARIEAQFHHDVPPQKGQLLCKVFGKKRDWLPKYTLALDDVNFIEGRGSSEDEAVHYKVMEFDGKDYS